jgi:hypothetical protein
MKISFSTICRETARKYLNDPKYNYFNDEVKELILKYVGKGVLRVQDPFMYPNPSLEIEKQEVYNEIKNRISNSL